MAGLDSMMGSWEIDNSLTENYDAFADVMEIPADMRTKMKDAPVSAVLSRDGDTITSQNDVAGHKETLVFRLGEKFTTNTMGLNSENVFTMDGDVLVGEHTVFGKTTTSRRSVKDGKLIIETKFQDVVLKNVFRRV